MGTQSGSSVEPLRVVLDTNVVLSSLLFRSGRMSWLSDALHGGEFVPLISRECVVELLRVLTYPKFKLSEMEQKAVLGAYLPFAETVHIPDRKLTTLPKCRDKDDVKFMVLAHVGKADCLVSGDLDLLELANLTKFCILSPEEFHDRLVWQSP